MMKKFKLLLFFCVISLGITSCGNNKELVARDLISSENVTKVELINGANGTRTSIVEGEKISELIALFDPISFKSKSKQEITGYLYSLQLFNGENSISKMALINSKLISMDNKFYEIGPNNLKDSLQNYLN